MNSIDIVDFRYSLRNYINNHPFPTELKRMIVNDILIDLNNQANNEILAQAEDREKGLADEVKDEEKL